MRGDEVNLCHLKREAEHQPQRITLSSKWRENLLTIDTAINYIGLGDQIRLCHQTEQVLRNSEGSLNIHRTCCSAPIQQTFHQEPIISQGKPSRSSIYCHDCDFFNAVRFADKASASSQPFQQGTIIPPFLPARLISTTSSLSAFLGYSYKVTPSIQHHLFITTVSRFFTDKSGAASPDQASEESPVATSPPPKRPSFLHRLHIHSSGKKPKPPALTIRPTTSSSLPVRSSSKPRVGSSHSDAVTVAEITKIMPQSLNLSTPPQASNKRQRSRDSRKEASRPGSAGQTAPPPPPPNDAERLARRRIRLPAYLNKTKSGTAGLFLML